MSSFMEELEFLINSKSMENESNTPDYVLARFLQGCLNSFNGATLLRDKHYNITHSIDGEPMETTGSLSEDYATMKADRKARKASNTKNSRQMLEDECVCFEIKNGGSHLIVEGNESLIDFWPGTGKWHCRTGKKGFGVKNLLKYIQ